jgi:hypothetical protein
VGIPSCDLPTSLRESVSQTVHHEQTTAKANEEHAMRAVAADRPSSPTPTRLGEVCSVPWRHACTGRARYKTWRAAQNGMQAAALCMHACMHACAVNDRSTHRRVKGRTTAKSFVITVGSRDREDVVASVWSNPRCSPVLFLSRPHKNNNKARSSSSSSSSSSSMVSVNVYGCGRGRVIDSYCVGQQGACGPSQGAGRVAICSVAYTSIIAHAHNVYTRANDAHGVATALANAYCGQQPAVDRDDI